MIYKICFKQIIFLALSFKISFFVEYLCLYFFFLHEMLCLYIYTVTFLEFNPKLLEGPLHNDFICKFLSSSSSVLLYIQSDLQKGSENHFMANSKLQAFWNHPAGPKTSLFTYSTSLYMLIFCWLFTNIVLNFSIELLVEFILIR